MSNIWFISDTHFNHSNILKFHDIHGNPTRVFDDVSHMNEVMIQRWNECVKEQDKVYHLGDVYFGPEDEAANILARLNGKKRLVVGNHDKLKSPLLQKYFQKIMLWRKFPEFGLLLTHVPCHDSVLGEGRFKGVPVTNVHGHIHQNKSPSPKHVNVCVEQTDYRPVHLDELRKMCQNVQGS